ncbi:hypothetical protein [Algoriphagus hitonicola]|uniref:6-bladed beta-propeller protein n=1 Tax=Algoriphagus hitonicola TaxID=435880 RepID=A0A1I2P852_9BACT|nr:hypothetical protein [Algoriphagus hitonicola]SFG11683.1 hypothetical protein SAMN04487988_101465 [Algoriphagus hitonicola]
MRNFIFLAVLGFWMISCGTSDQNTKEETDRVPELTLVDSMQIDRLVVPTLLDYSEDGKHFLFFDFQSNELILTDPLGKVLISTNRSEDGPNSYKSGYFSACRFVNGNQILVDTYAGSFLYDFAFNLIDSKPAKIQTISQMLGDTPGFVVDENYQFKFGYLESDLDQIRVDDQLKMDEYDFLKVSNADGEVKFSSQVPRSVNYIQKPGQYMGYDPIAKIKNDRIYLQFMLTPAIYTYSFPELELLDSINLDPGENFRPTEPAPEQENFGIFFEDLKGSRYENFIFSNDYLLTWYLKGAPDEEVDALDRRVVGDEKYQAVEKKYKTPVYQIYKEKEKIWEGEWPIKLNVKKDLLYSVNAKPGEDPNSVERDVQTFYFYELR